MAGVLLSSKSLLCLLECLLACFSSKSCSACCVICSWLLGRFTLLVGSLGLWGCLACGEVIFCLLLFPVSINKLKIYE